MKKSEELNEKITVVVPIYNALEEVKLLLDSLKENFNFYLGETILINDCSKQDTTDFLNKFAKDNTQFILVNNEENLGFIKTCNKGMKMAKGDIVVLLNSDTIIPKEFCERIIKCFNSDSKIGTASPISSFSGQNYIPLRENMSIEDMNNLLRLKHKCIYPRLSSAEGFCYCIRKSVIETQGYLDEIYGKGYCEEVDFSQRASVNGWKNVLIDDLYVYHKRCCSFGKKKRTEQMKKNNDIYNSRYAVWRCINIPADTMDIIKKEMFPPKRIFSVRNEYNNSQQHKIISILGIKIKIRVK